MKTRDVIHYFKEHRGMNKTNLAGVLDISKASLSLWKPVVPVRRALELLVLSDYKIPFKASDYGKDGKFWAGIAKTMRKANHRG